MQVQQERTQAQDQILGFRSQLNIQKQLALLQKLVSRSTLSRSLSIALIT